MKKTIDSKKLRLDTNTIRAMDFRQLDRAAGAKQVLSFGDLLCYSMGMTGGCTAPTAIC